MNVLDIKPVVKSNTKCWLLFKKNSGDMYCLGNISKNGFIKIAESQVQDVNLMISLMDGKHTLENIDRQITSYDVESLYNIMCKANLIEGINSNYQNNEFELYSLNIFKFSTKKFSRAFQIIGKLLTQRLIVFLGVVLIIFSFLISMKSIPQFMTSPGTYRIVNSDSLNIVIYYLISISSILLHELGHAVVAARYRIPPVTFTVALYLWVSPIVYLTIPGIYTRTPKKRIYIWGAGMYTNLIICAISMIIYMICNSEMAALTFVVNLTLVMVNISPLMPLDGYFMICTMLKTVNMREQFLHPFSRENWRRNNIYVKAYNVISLCFVLYVLITQVIWIIKYVADALFNTTSVLQFIYNIRLILIAMLLLLLSRVFKYVLKSYMKTE